MTLRKKERRVNYETPPWYKACSPGGAGTSSGRSVLQPGCRYRGKPDEILLIADVPGAKPEDIDVQFEDGTLTLHARVTPRYAEGVEFLRQEYGVGDFLRVFHVSEAIDAAKISAEYADGVLTLHLPKSAGLRPRKIEVAVKS